MTIADLIRLAQNRLMTLNTRVTVAIRDGDADAVARLDAEIAQTQETLNQLQSI